MSMKITDLEPGKSIFMIFVRHALPAGLTVGGDKKQIVMGPIVKADPVLDTQMMVVGNVSSVGKGRVTFEINEGGNVRPITLRVFGKYVESIYETREEADAMIAVIESRAIPR